MGPDEQKEPRERIGPWAVGSLIGALVLAILGKTLEYHHWHPFWTGLLVAFAEAAVVGGLADWFAVRALFTHPFGIPFPHTALIPRNRQRIVAVIRDMVQNEWLPPDLLKGKVQEFDFVGQALLPVVDPLEPHLTEVIRSVGKELLAQTSPGELAGVLARSLSDALDPDNLGPFLAGLLRRTREQHWLEPILHQLVSRLRTWVESPSTRVEIRARLEHAAHTYQGQDWFKTLTYHLAEAFGGVDLDAATEALVREINQFASDQLAEESQLQQLLADTLAHLETRFREDAAFLDEVRRFLLEQAQEQTLGQILEAILGSLKQETEQELTRADSHLLGLAVGHARTWMQRIAGDLPLRERINGWCQRLAVSLIDRHHSFIGILVEEQLSRLTEENLSEVIQAKVGEDLNWIRLNGTFVGGLVGATLYLMFALVASLL
jgi:uncharacterized membrane-anchored protein YjiN (DUF445 family)